VCIVQKRDARGNMYAMKYVRKGECAERGALKNVAREVEILSRLEHPCLVNLWFSFQDEEDLFMVSDLLLGGDLRYHLQQDVQFSEESVTLFIAEVALALDYLQKNRIVHRDIKPDNILLDEEAPEIYKCSCEEFGVLGYGFAVDWWSLGVLAWETLAGSRPFAVHASTSYREALQLLANRPEPPSRWSQGIRDVIERLLAIEPLERCSTLKELKQLGPMVNMDFDAVLKKRIKPAFTPPKDHLNCDPTFELEEMIVETKPLHKKKKRLAKQRSLIRAESLADEHTMQHHAQQQQHNQQQQQHNQQSQQQQQQQQCSQIPIGQLSEQASIELQLQQRLAFIPEYRVYNRERELERQERERKERQWEEELNTAMNRPEPAAAAQSRRSGSFGIDASAGREARLHRREPRGVGELLGHADSRSLRPHRRLSAAPASVMPLSGATTTELMCRCAVYGLRACERVKKKQRGESRQSSSTSPYSDQTYKKASTSGRKRLILSATMYELQLASRELDTTLCFDKKKKKNRKHFHRYHKNTDFE
ncbi:unnamed protein product, partial [Trichogramma brassicae]